MQISIETIVNLAYRDGFLLGSIDLKPDDREKHRKEFVDMFREIKFTDNELRMLTYSWYKGRFERRKQMRKSDLELYFEFCEKIKDYGDAMPCLAPPYVGNRTLPGGST